MFSTRIVTPKPVFTDPMASPTGFPFKVVELEGTLADDSVYSQRRRLCDSGYLRRLYRKEDGSVGYRCPAEPEKDYVAKGGDACDTPGRKCLCNALIANIGMGQVRGAGQELPLLTAGDDLTEIATLMGEHFPDFSADDVLELLLASDDGSYHRNN
jgi:nitronate monooxygenase